MSLLELNNVGKFYNSDGNIAVGIRGVNVSFDQGEFVLITGASGSGKSTLLNVLSGLTNIQEGEFKINGEDSSYFGEEDYERYRKNYVSFIFQNYNLIDSYTVYENIELELIAKGIEKKERKNIILDIADKVGLKDKLKERVTKLSGGQKQRVSIARALVSDAPILACDEITGNLDHQTSIEIIELLRNLSSNKLVLMVTHDPDEVLKFATRLINMVDGAIVRDQKINEYNKQEAVEIKEKEEIKGDDFHLAFKGLFNTPKRSFLMFLILLLATCIIGFTVASVSSIDEDEYYSWNNYIEGQVFVRKYNGDVITDSEAASFNRFGVDYVNQKYYFNGPSFYIYSIDVDYYFDEFHLESIDDETPNLAYGALPSNSKEVVLSFLNPIDYEGMVGEKIEFYCNGHNLVYTVSGIAEHRKSSPDKIYLSREGVKYIEPFVLFEYIELYYSNTSPSYGFNYIYFYVDEELPANTISDSEPYDDYSLISLTYSKHTNETLLQDFNVVYASEERINALKESGVIDPSLIIGEQSETPFVPMWFGAKTELVGLSTDIYNFLLNITKTEVEVKFNKTMLMESQISAFIDDCAEKGFFAVHNYEEDIDFMSIAEAIVNSLMYIFCVGLTAIVYLLGHISLKNVMISQKQDFLVMKSLGIKSKSIKKQIYLEMFIMMTIIAILYVIFIVVMKSINVDIYSFWNRFHQTRFSDLLLCLILLYSLVFFLARKFGKETFAASAAPKATR